MSAFTSNQEIDEYYDNQIKALQEENIKKNQSIQEQLQKDLDAVDTKTQAEIWNMYKQVYGDQFEMVKPFLPASNPDPYFFANHLIGLDRETALIAIQNISIINKDLANKILSIYDSKNTTVKKAPPSAQSLFNYLENLSSDEANKNLILIKSDNPTLYSEVNKLILNKYPNGKPGSAMYQNYLDTLEIKNTKASVTPSITPVVKNNLKVNEEQKDEISTPIENTVEEKTSTMSEDEINKMVQERVDKVLADKKPKPSFFKRVTNFLFGWL